MTAAAEVAETKPCPDPDCGGLADPEQDSDLLYFACRDCGYEFGYERVETAAFGSDGTCALGVPVGVRAAVSAPAKPTPVQLGATIPIRSSS